MRLKSVWSTPLLFRIRPWGGANSTSSYATPTRIRNGHRTGGNETKEREGRPERRFVILIYGGQRETNLWVRRPPAKVSAQRGIWWSEREGVLWGEELQPVLLYSPVRPHDVEKTLESQMGRDCIELYWIYRPLYGNVFKLGCQRLLRRAEGWAKEQGWPQPS